MRWKIVISILAIPVLSSCASLFYYPTDKVYFEPEKAGLLKEEVNFQTKTGEKIHGWWFSTPKPTAKGTIVYFHGNAENLTSHFMFLMWLPAEGYNYFIFDYPGYGKSAGSPSPARNSEAGKEAIRWVAKNKPTENLFIYGHSLGGNIALRVALELKEEFRAKAVVIEASFQSYESIAAKKLSSFWLTWPLQPLAYLLLSDKYAPQNIQELSPTPLLVIHGQKDIQVEPEFGDEIYNQAKEPKSIWRIEDGFHGSTYWKHDFKYRRKLIEYFENMSEPTSY